MITTILTILEPQQSNNDNQNMYLILSFLIIH